MFHFTAEQVCSKIIFRLLLLVTLIKTLKHTKTDFKRTLISTWTECILLQAFTATKPLVCSMQLSCYSENVLKIFKCMHIFCLFCSTAIKTVITFNCFCCASFRKVISHNYACKLVKPSKTSPKSSPHCKSLTLTFF